MNAPVNRDQLAEPFHACRSDVVDAFAEAEAAVIAILLRHAHKPLSNAPLSQKIAAAAKIQASPHLSHKRRDEVAQALEYLRSLLAHRAEVVHSPMRVFRSRDDRIDYASFTNPAMQGGPGINARLYRIEDLRELAKEVRSISDKLKI